MLKTFDRTAMDASGKQDAYSVEAHSEQQAITDLRGAGLFVTSCRPSTFIEAIEERHRHQPFWIKAMRCLSAIWHKYDVWVYIALVVAVGIGLIFGMAFAITYESPAYQQSLHESWQKAHGKTIAFDDWRRLRREHLLPGQQSGTGDVLIVPIQTGGR